MTDDDTLHFLSLRRALKICSYAFLAVSLLRIPWVMVSVGRASSVFEDLMGGAALPAVLTFANMFRNNLLLFMPVMFLVLAVAAVVTVRSKGGLFLYVNCGLALLFSAFASSFAFAAQEAMRLPFEKLFQQRWRPCSSQSVDANRKILSAFANSLVCEFANDTAFCQVGAQ